MVGDHTTSLRRVSIGTADQTGSVAPALCNFSLLTSRNHSSLFSDWRRTVSSKFFDTQVSSVSTEKLVLSRHARCVLSRLRCNGHTLLLNSYLFRIGRIKNAWCSVCPPFDHGRLSSDFALSSYVLFVPLAFWRPSVSPRPLIQALESCSASGATWSSVMPPSMGRGRVTTTTT